MKPYGIAKFLWLCCLLASAVFLVWRFAQGPAFDSNLLALLPNDERDPASEIASQQFLEQGNRKILFLLGHPQPGQSQQAARRFAQQLSTSPYFPNLKIERSESMDDFYDLYFPYRYGLTADRLMEELKTPNGLDPLIQQNRTWLSTPMGMMVNPDWQSDPMGFFPRLLMNFPKTLSHVQWNDGLLTLTVQDKTYTLIEATLQRTPFQLKDQKEILAAIDSARHAVKREFPDLDFRFTGMLRFAAATAQTLSSEISIVGTLSLLLVAGLVLWMFRSWLALALCLFPIFAGCLVAMALGLAIYPKLNLLTLGFGTSLIGVCEDYGIHLLVKHQNSRQSPFYTLRKLHPALMQGAGTTILGFLGLALPNFPGLRQMALFATFGVLGALATVYLVLPGFLKVSHEPVQPKLYTWIQNLRLPALSAKRIFLVVFPLLLCMAVGITKIKFDDNLKLLQKTPQHLIDSQRAIQEDLGMFELGYYFWIKGTTPEEVLQKLEKTERQLENHPGAASSFSLAQFILSENTQVNRAQAVRSALKTQFDVIEQHYLNLFFDPQTIRQFRISLDTQNTAPLTMQNFLDHPATQGLRHFWFDDGAGHVFSPILLQGINDLDELEKMSDPAQGIFFVNQINHVSQIFKRFRVLSSKMVLLFYGFIFAWLAWRFGFRKGALVFLPALLSGVVTLGVLGFLGHPLHLFHLFSLLLVLGLGIDFAIFFAEENAFSPSTVMSVGVSALSTFFSFGLLAFCTTPVLQSMGLTVTIGLMTAVIFSPLACAKTI